MQTELTETALIPQHVERLDPFKLKVAEGVALLKSFTAIDGENLFGGLDAATAARTLEKLTEETRKELVKPLNDNVKLINDYAKSTLAPLVTARETLTGLINDYQATLEESRLEALEAAKENQYRRISALQVLNDIKTGFFEQLRLAKTSAVARAALEQIKSFAFEDPAYSENIGAEIEEARELISTFAQKRLEFLESIEEDERSLGAYLDLGERYKKSEKLQDRKDKFSETSSKAYDRQIDAAAKALAKTEKQSEKELRDLEKQTPNLRKQLKIEIENFAAVYDHFKKIDEEKLRAYIYEQLKTLPIERIQTPGVRVTYEKKTNLPKPETVLA